MPSFPLTSTRGPRMRCQPLPARTYTRFFTITGVTKDVTGAILPNVVVDLFVTATKALYASTVSDANGVYVFTLPDNNTAAYRADGYKVTVGSPDVAGTTLNTLQGV